MLDRNKFLVFCHIYNLCGVLALMAFFIVYCIQDHEFWLHLAGIIINLLPTAYAIYMVLLDIKAYRLKKAEKQA